MKNVSLSGNRPPAPELSGSARDAVRYRGGHLQIIAAAGSGKTEVVSQRVADLLADGLPALWGSRTRPPVLTLASMRFARIR